MSDDNAPVWPVGMEWPAGMLPPPSLTIELSALELEALISHHDELARTGQRDHDHDVELFHGARASYLRQRLAATAPERPVPD